MPSSPHRSSIVDSLAARQDPRAGQDRKGKERDRNGRPAPKRQSDTNLPCSLRGDPIRNLSTAWLGRGEGLSDDLIECLVECGRERIRRRVGMVHCVSRDDGGVVGSWWGGVSPSNGVGAWEGNGTWRWGWDGRCSAV
jgi:hypothetical protein